MNKEVKALLKDLDAAGWPTKRTSKGHHMVFHPETGRKVTTLAGTPSDPRSLKNSLADLKRAGFDWKAR